MVEPQPVPATPEVLAKVLDSRPVLWVGAGVSMAAGHPGTGRLVEAMAERCYVPLTTGQRFERVADAFVEAMGGAALADVLQQELGDSPRLTPLHRALARAAGDGKLAALVTTNYDDLLERALGEAGVRYVPQSLEQNSVVVDPEAPLRLLKLHGSRTDWQRVVLSGEAYERFGERYPFLEQQLQVLLRRHPVLFVGCSLRDRRILEWLEGLDEQAAGRLKPWPALLTRGEWEAAWAEGGEALGRGRVMPLILEDHEQLQRLWVEVVPERVPAGEVEITFEVGAEGVVGRSGGGEGWAVEEPWEEKGFKEGLEVLRELGVRALPADKKGRLTPQAAHMKAVLRQQAVAVGERLAGLLSPAARQRLVELEAAGRPGLPGLVRLRVAVGTGGDARRADRLLALPWELLRVGDRFPVEENTFDLVREAVVPGEPGLGEPDEEMSVVATVAAPVDQVPVDHEREMYRLWQALGAEDEGRLRVTDLGTLDDLAAAVENARPPVVHFTGHGTPGALVFEDPAAGSDPVDVRELIQRLKSRDAPLPRLIYLSSCHGTTAAEAAEGTAVGGLAAAGARETLDTSSEAAPEPPAAAQRREAGRLVEPGVVELQPATAAALHRGGFAQVVGYLGPVGDDQATRLAAEFYSGLARGQTARVALRAARELAKKKLRHGDGWAVYPLGWAQVALYHRGGDHPTALPATAVEARLDAPPRRVFVRLDREGGWERVERRHDGPVVGVQQLRHGFIGRRGPRAEALRRWRDGQRLLVVQGLGGLGKTALCAELLRMLPAAKVVALDGRHAGSQPDPLVALWQEVAAARPDAEWAEALGALQREGLSGEGLVAAFALLARAEGSLVVYLDDAESLQEPVADGGELGRWRDERLAAWWRGMVELAAPGGPVGVLASSRYRPAGTPAAAVLNLPPMSDWEMVRLMSWMPRLRRVPHRDREWLVGRLSGHPRTVEWLEVLAAEAEGRLAPPGGRFAGDWRGEILEPILEDAGERVEGDLLLEKVWEALEAGSREHLGRCSVIQAPAPWEAVGHLAPEEVEGSAGRLVDAADETGGGRR